MSHCARRHARAGSVPAAPPLEHLQVDLQNVTLARFQSTSSAGEEDSAGAYLHLAARGCQVAGRGGTEACWRQLVRCAETDESSGGDRGVRGAEDAQRVVRFDERSLSILESTCFVIRYEKPYQPAFLFWTNTPTML